MYLHELSVGQICWLKSKKHPGGDLVKVLKVNTKNVRVTMQDGQLWTVDPFYLREAVTADKLTFKLDEAPASSLVRGQVVRFKSTVKTGGGKKYPLLVVLGRRGETYSVAPLGGDKGTYFTNISAAQIEVVPFNVDGI